MMQRVHKRFKTMLRLGHFGNREGFTLVEMLMVMMILTVGVLPIAIIQHQAKREVTESDQFSTAIIVAQDQLEGLKGMGFGNIVADAGAVDNVTWASSVTNVSFGLDRIEVTATWTSNGEAQSLTIADLVSMR